MGQLPSRDQLIKDALPSSTPPIPDYHSTSSRTPTNSHQHTHHSRRPRKSITFFQFLTRTLSPLGFIILVLFIFAAVLGTCPSRSMIHGALEGMKMGIEVVENLLEAGGWGPCGVPGVPDRPDVPGEPGVPGKPKPCVPSKPDKPSVPDEPDNPSKPENPEQPGSPDKPDKPTEPKKPTKPDLPDKPYIPGKPSVPEKPELPDKPDVPDDLDAPCRSLSPDSKDSQKQQPIFSDKPGGGRKWCNATKTEEKRRDEADIKEDSEVERAEL